MSEEKEINYKDSTEEDREELEKKQKEKASKFIVSYDEDTEIKKVLDDYEGLEEDNKDNEDNDEDEEDEEYKKKENRVIIIVSSILTLLILSSLIVVLLLIDAKKTVYDIDSVYYTEQGLVPQIDKAIIYNNGEDNIVLGNGLLKVANVEVKEVERPMLSLSNDTLIYVCRTLGYEVLHINEDDEMLTSAGIEEGDVIYQVQNETITSEEQLRNRLAEFIERDGVYTLYKDSSHLIESTYLQPTKKLSFEGTYDHVYKRAITFIVGGKCYSYGIKDFNLHHDFYWNKIVGNSGAYSNIGITNCYSLYEANKDKNAKIVEQNNYGTVYTLSGGWDKETQLPLGFAWEIDKKEKAYMRVVNPTSGSIENIEINIEKDRYLVDNISDYVFNIASEVELTEDMIGSPIIQNNKIIGVYIKQKADEQGKGIFMAIDRIYFEWFNNF